MSSVVNRRVIQPMSRVIDLTLDWLYSPACAVCRGRLDVGSDILCRTCWGQLAANIAVAYCPTCGRTAGDYECIEGRCHGCRDEKPVVDAVIRVGSYDTPLKELVLGFKFSHRDRLDRFLGGLMAAAMRGRTAELESIDCLVPVPLHWRRKLARGYNQSQLLAHAAARALRRQGWKGIVQPCLVRTKNTIPQAQLPASSRVTNLRHAFAMRGRYRDAAAGKIICLVDDVTTTGTTLKMTAGVLKRAGARRVLAVVIASAGR